MRSRRTLRHSRCFPFAGYRIAARSAAIAELELHRVSIGRNPAFEVATAFPFFLSSSSIVRSSTSLMLMESKYGCP